MYEIIQVDRYKGEGRGEKQQLKVLIDKIREHKGATQQCSSPPRGAELNPRAPRSLMLQGRGTLSQAESQDRPGSHKSPAMLVAAGQTPSHACLGNGSLMSS